MTAFLYQNCSEVHAITGVVSYFTQVDQYRLDRSGQVRFSPVWGGGVMVGLSGSVIYLSMWSTEGPDQNQPHLLPPTLSANQDLLPVFKPVVHAEGEPFSPIGRLASNQNIHRRSTAHGLQKSLRRRSSDSKSTRRLNTEPEPEAFYWFHYQNHHRRSATTQLISIHVLYRRG